MKNIKIVLVAVIIMAAVSVPSFLRAGENTPLKVRAILGGAYNPETGLMRDSLRQQGLIPTKEPYTEMGYHFTEGVQQIADDSVFNKTGSEAIVDWVILEIRARRSGTPVVYSTSALIRADGYIVATDGVSPVTVPISGFDYYLSIRHRNHLAIMTARPGDLKRGADFTAIPLYGSEAAKEIAGVQVLWPGNANFNSNVSYIGYKNDKDVIGDVVGIENPNNVVTGYYGADINMDGVVKYTGSMNDRDIVLQTLGGIPTKMRVEQMPKIK